MVDKSDKELMELVIDGHSIAFKELYKRYDKAIFNFIFQYTGSRELAQDLLQETFTRVWFSAHTFKLKSGNFKGWLYKIALNITRSEMSKKRYSYRYLEFSQISNFISEISYQSIRPDQEFELKNTIAYAVGKLKPFLREVVVLKVYHQLKFKEISEITNTPIGTLKARFHNAIEQLREIFEEKGM